jgi:hypothetical protein
MFKKLFFSFISIFIFSYVILADVPMHINFQAKLATSEGGLIKNVHKNVSVRLYNGPNTSHLSWKEYHKGVWFNEDGVCSIIIGDINPLSTKNLNLADPYIGIKIDGLSDTAFISLHSTPYAIQAKVANEALAVDASRIYGEFNKPVIISSNLVVSNNTLFVDSTKQRVGIGTTTPLYSLDVSGNINAKGYQINGKDIQSQLSWQRETNHIFYDKGYVGIGTNTPSYNLDVVGTINASEYYVNRIPLSQTLRAGLAWQDGLGDDIYFAEGDVGIGTEIPVVRLDVSGAIKVGAFKNTRGKAKPGTIQFLNGDFLGWIGDEGWKSLTSLNGTGKPGQLAFWNTNESITGSPLLFWDNKNTRLGIGAITPNAQLEISTTDNEDLLYISKLNETTNQKDPLLYVGYVDASATYNIGVGTDNPKAKLAVEGGIDASGFTINGVPLEYSISAGSYWYKENNGRLFYDEGSIGIGTSSPRNLLELASRTATSNPALTFDIFGKDLFTLGIDHQYPEAFIIAQGSDLDIPVFVFKGQKIGVGLQDPNANLHVSGNSGVVIEGNFIDGTIPDDSEDSLQEEGSGSKLIWYPAKSVFRAGTSGNDTWNKENLGDYSVGMGYKPLASGKYSTISGGYGNTASGYGATIPGGLENIASGRYSFAAGHRAKALHDYSFVWADYTPDLDSFSSTYPRQFLIRAINGVGIGTTDTKGAVLTVARNKPDEIVFRALDNQGNSALAITTSGNVGIGTDTPGKAKLAVLGGYVGIGTTVPSATLTIVNENANELIFVVQPENSVTTGILVNSKGQVGVGITRGYVFDPGTQLKVNGGIKASSFKVVDPNDPDGEITLQPNPGSPWADPSKNDNNTHRSQGKVGIGTSKPNSLLELSNGNEKKSLPVITFDIDGNDIFSIGPTLNAEKTEYLFTFQPSSSLTTTPSLTIASSSIGIGLGLQTPSATLHVSGNTLFEGKVGINTRNIENGFYSLVVDGAINVDELYRKGILFEPQFTPWKTKGKNIYYSSGNVGIGTENPGESLEVVGTVQSDKLILNNTMRLDGYLTSDKLELRDTNSSVTSPGVLIVDSGQLKWKGPTDNSYKIISSPLQRADGSEGNLAFWVNEATLGESSMYWKEIEKELKVSGNFIIDRTTTLNGFIATSQITIGAPTPFAVSTNLSYVANPYSVRSFNAGNIDISIKKNWGHPASTVKVKGLNINMQNTNDTYLYSDATAIGLNVDVSKVKTKSGKKYAAIFQGGNVGIGIENPTVELEIAGTVSANYFNLSGGLTVPQLVVSKDTFIAIAADSKLEGNEYIPRVGINITDIDKLKAGDNELWVNGTVSADSLIVKNGIEATTLNVYNGTLVVDDNGNIGIGTTAPDGQIEIHKEISELTDIDNDFYSEKIYLLIDGDEPGKPFYLDKNMTGLDIRINTDVSNTIEGEVVGIKLNMSTLNIQSNSKVIGLDVNVENPDSTIGTRYAAIFKGGYVGIGTTTPETTLDVKGDIKADNLILDGTLSAEGAQFNYLTVAKAATFNGTVTVNKNLVVLGTATINHLVLGDKLESAEGSFATLNANIASFNTSLKTATLIATTVDSKSGYFDKLGIGKAPLDGNAITVSGNISASTIYITDRLVLESATLNINNGSLYIPPTGKYVGIGTKQPQAPLHVYHSSVKNGVFSAANNKSWNAINIQTKATNANLAAGIILAPDSNAPSPDIGSGIVAIRTDSRESEPGSHLVFITDPEDSTPKERLRITSEGKIGIGTTTPSSILDVNGSAYFSDSITVNGTLSVSTITGINGLTIEPDGQLNVEGTASFNSDVLINNGLYLKKTTQTPTSSADYGVLYTDSNSSLYYIEPGGTTPVNISAPFIGSPNRLAYFNNGGSLSDNANLFWDNTNSVFQIGTKNVNTSLEIVNTVNATLSGKVAAQKIHMMFKDRTLNSTPGTFSGLNIELSSENPDSETEFGRLANGETALGLKVDVSKLKTKHFRDETELKGYKYSAIFMGGGVGIGTTAPEAALHIKSEESSNIPFRVDTKIDDTTFKNAIIVSNNSYVGVGTANPTARLSIQTESTTESPLKILDSEDNPIMYIKPNGYIGIGTSTPQTNLDVNGTISANIGTFSSLQAVTLNIGNGAFFIDVSGNVGIGTTTPSGNLAFYKKITSDTSLPDNQFISHKLDLLLSGGTETKPFRFQRNLTGLNIDIKSADNTRLGSSTTSSKNATGIKVDMSDLVIDETNPASAIGLYVDVSKATTLPETGGTRYAAIFEGGKVGIGTPSPSYELDVSGDINADSLFLSGKLEANIATFNSIDVINIASFNKAVTINNRLYANTVSANNIILSGTLRASTASFTTVSSNTASFTKLGIGIPNPTTALAVSGNTYVSGNLEISGTLTIATINNTAGSVTINLSSGSSLIVSGSIAVEEDLSIGKSILFTKQTSAPSSVSSKGLLYVDDSGNLKYVNPATSKTVNLSSLSGTPNRIPYYDHTNGDLSDDAYLAWNKNTRTNGAATTTIHQLKVGTSNALTSLKLETHIDENITGNIAAHNIDMSFGNRNFAGNSTVFTGLKINLSGTNLTDTNTFGRIADQETAVGLKVDVSDLVARYQSQDIGGSAYHGYKYAALFLGGNVGIGTSAPNASLHIANETSNSTTFRVDNLVQEGLNTITKTALVVSSNSYVGIGTSAPDAQLTILASTSAPNTSALNILQTNEQDSLLILKNSGRLGIGTNVPSATVHIVSEFDPLRISTSTAPNALVVTENGLVGIGTSLPSALLHAVGASSGTTPIFKAGIQDTNPNALVVDKDGQVGIGFSDPYYALSVKGIIHGGTKNATTVPTWLNSSSSSQGYLFNANDNLAFFGLKENTDSSYDSVIYWGTADEDALHFEHLSGITTTNIMTLKGNKRVGIGTTIPSANLTVSGNFRVDLDNYTAFIITKNGMIGIGTTFPSTNLHVNGALMANSLEINDGGINISTLNVSGTLEVYKEAYDQTIDSVGHVIEVAVSRDMQMPITGLDINLKSSWFETDQRGYALWGDGVAYGLKVDVSNLTVGDASLSDTFARKYAGIFMGGNVGIGTNAPQAGLHVHAPVASDIARFGSLEGNLTIHDFGNGIFGFYNIDSENDQTYHHTLSLAPGLSTTPGDVAGRVGIGIVNPNNTTLDKSMVVNGDVRLGQVRDNNNQTSRYGNKLWFSGGPDIDSGEDANGNPYTNENRDPIWMARYNRDIDVSELRVNVGSKPEGDNGVDRFVVGYKPSDGSFQRVFQVLNNNKVGILGDIENPPNIDDFPKATFHVAGQATGEATELKNHVVAFENYHTERANTLAIYHSLDSGVSAAIPTKSHFITFFMGSKEVGAIEGNGLEGEQRGVRFKTTAADYAEYLPRLDSEEKIVKGDIVGVFNGKISKNTKDAQHIMVISSAPGVAGNYPGTENEANYELVAFFGQVKVKIIGTVNKGDYIIPSGKNDGTGIGVSPNAIEVSQINNILGRAWESSVLETEKQIQVAVGFNFSLPSLKKEIATLDTLEQEIAELKVERKNIVSNFDKKLAAQNKQIQKLLKKISY